MRRILLRLLSRLEQYACLRGLDACILWMIEHGRDPLTTAEIRWWVAVIDLIRKARRAVER